MKLRIEKNIFILLLFAIPLTLICFKSSFLYPYNDWDDANIYLSLGRMVANGKIPYVDVYIHSGPLTILLWTLLYMIPGDHFTGLYLVEMIAAVSFLLISYKTAKLLSSDTSIVGIMGLGFIYSSEVFRAGGSLEELYLPLLMYVVYVYIKAMDKDIEPTAKESVLLGMIIGILLFTKYTLLATFLGVYLCYTYHCLRKKAYSIYFKFVGYNILGCFIIALPIIFVLYRLGIMQEMIDAYIVDNLFNYNMDTPFWGGFVYGALTTPGFVITVLGAIVILLRCRKKKDILVISGVLFVITFMKMPYGYYEIPLSILVALAVPYVVDNIKWLDKYKCLIGFVILVLIYYLSPNTYLMEYDKEDLPQYKYREIIQDESLLCITLLDLGFYTVSDKEIPGEYIGIYNVNQDKVLEELLRLANLRKYEYIIADRNTNPVVSVIEGYDLVDTQEFIRDAIINYTETYYLYRKNE